MVTKEAFDTLWKEELIPEFKKLEPLKRKDDRAKLAGGAVAILTALLISLMGQAQGGGGLWFDPRFLLLGIVPGTGLYYLLKPKQYKKKYKDLIVKKILSLCNFSWEPDFNVSKNRYRKDAVQQGLWRSLFEASGLYRANLSGFRVDDVLHGSGESAAGLRMAEVAATTGHGKHSKAVFSGIFFEIDIDRNFEGVTYFAKKPGRFDPTPAGVGTARGPKIERTDLEWIDFEKKIDVYTSNQREAREILTPDFMYIFYSWLHEHNVPVRVGFKDSAVYLSVEMTNMFEPTGYRTLLGHKKDVRLYFDAFILVEDLIRKLMEQERVQSWDVATA